ncbi:hypothetical protein [Vibrio sp. PID23_8]|uniref:hypothetical protein n=1 Tax=Vibrio sp. PID23_8 TaxID=1583767 RepID=UPI000E68757B|nr:hypothetical protein [Vibrio sp. PID23_8]RIZ51542.1 hypothetical protein AK966_17095 [Vibrio sp. PID23_8]
MTFKINVKEITENPPITDSDLIEMAFYVKQTLERYSEMVNNGYDSAENKFEDEEIADMTTIQFNPNKNELVEYAQSHCIFRSIPISHFGIIRSPISAVFQASCRLFYNLVT